MWRWILGVAVVGVIGAAGYAWWSLKGPPRAFYAELLVHKYPEFGDVQISAVGRDGGNWHAFQGTAVLVEPRYEPLLLNGQRDLQDYCGFDRDHVFDIEGLSVARVAHPVGTEVTLAYRTAPYRLSQTDRRGDFVWRGWSTGTWGGNALLAEGGARLSGFGPAWFARGERELYIVAAPEDEPLCQESGG